MHEGSRPLRRHGAGSHQLPAARPRHDTTPPAPLFPGPIPEHTR